ncbi:CYTH-like domain-containing protein [Umbelopsis sp. PMI_123]|nr:CYTH-like domain-containing protein [Umbelopsis sp. PMI_123]
MNTLDTTAVDKEDSTIQEEPSNIKRKLDQISTKESTAPLNSSENGSTQDMKKARMESLRLPTIFGSKPVNDTVQYVANFLWRYCEQENVEIEAKLGTIIDKKTWKRLSLPVGTEAVILPPMESHIRFQSDMSLSQHRMYNMMLNEMVQKPPEGGRVKYKHTRERDRFFKLSDGRKIRVTTDQQTGEIVPNGILEKTRIADLNIYSPNQPFDFRISVSIENPASMPGGSHIYERNKDRLSYSHGNIQFDLTQVKSPDFAGKQDVTHELELEFIDTRILANEKRKQAQGEPSAFASMVELFLDNARILSERGGRG